MDTRKQRELRRQEQMSQWREKRQAWFNMPQPAMCAFHYFSKDRSRREFLINTMPPAKDG